MRITGALLLLFFSAAGVISQIGTDWCGVTSPAADLSLAFPCSSYVVDHQGSVYKLYYKQSGAAIFVSFERKGGARQEFKDELNYLSKEDRKDSKVFTRGDFLGRQVEGNSEPGAKKPFTSQWLHLASSKGEYIIYASADSEKAPIFTAFLYSIRIENNQLFSGPGPNVKSTIQFADLVTDQIVQEAVNKPDLEQKDIQSDTGDPEAADDSPVVYSRNLIVLRKPKALGLQKNGSVLLRVLFRADGTLGTVRLIKSTDKGLARKAFDAAKKIKFIPAEVNGKPVDLWRTVEYSFTIY